MSHTQLAAQVYTVRDQYKDHPEKLPEVFRRVREIGYEAVELIWPLQEDPAGIKKIVSGAGLEICAAQVSADKLFEDPEAAITQSRILGTTQMVVPSMPKPLWGNPEGVRRFAADLEKAGARLAAAGVTLSYHNHSHEFQKFEGKTELEMILEATRPEHLKIEVDTYWVQHGGGDVAEWIRRLSGRLDLLHMKDMGMVLREQKYAEPGEGNLNWPAILKAAREANVKWYIVELDVCPRDSFESLAISYRNCRGMGIG